VKSIIAGEQRRRPSTRTPAQLAKVADTMIDDVPQQEGRPQTNDTKRPTTTAPKVRPPPTLLQPVSVDKTNYEDVPGQGRVLQRTLNSSKVRGPLPDPHT